MKLPNAEQAIVEQAKIVDYLLNPAHPDNGGKVAFFLSLGFNREAWQHCRLVRPSAWAPKRNRNPILSWADGERLGLGLELRPPAQA